MTLKIIKIQLLCMLNISVTSFKYTINDLFLKEKYHLKWYGSWLNNISNLVLFEALGQYKEVNIKNIEEFLIQVPMTAWFCVFTKRRMSKKLDCVNSYISYKKFFPIQPGKEIFTTNHFTPIQQGKEILTTNKSFLNRVIDIYNSA